jgi:hypothetical protein
MPSPPSRDATPLNASESRAWVVLGAHTRVKLATSGSRGSKPSLSVKMPAVHRPLTHASSLCRCSFDRFDDPIAHVATSTCSPTDSRRSSTVAAEHRTAGGSPRRSSPLRGDHDLHRALANARKLVLTKALRHFLPVCRSFVHHPQQAEIEHAAKQLRSPLRAKCHPWHGGCHTVPRKALLTAEGG